MTYNTTNTEPENAGSLASVLATVDVTSLDSAGAEPIDPSDFGIEGEDRYGVAVRGQESSAYAITFDHINGQLSVVNVADGTDVAQGTDVGEVLLEFRGV